MSTLIQTPQQYRSALNPTAIGWFASPRGMPTITISGAAYLCVVMQRSMRPMSSKPYADKSTHEPRYPVLVWGEWGLGMKEYSLGSDPRVEYSCHATSSNQAEMVATAS